MPTESEHSNEEPNDEPSKPLVNSPGHKTPVLESRGYSVRHTIGNGSYAVVKAAYSSALKKEVAIKIIQKSKAPSDYLKKFLPREIDILKRLNHPHITSFYNAIDTSKRVYLVLELAENGDILDVINRQHTISEPQAGKWFYQMVEGISYCHEKGIVHRDLKCENILLDKDNNVKITDFGFARSTLTKADGNTTLSRTYCGSYSYAAPEVLTGTPYDPYKSDIWSLGVILFVMIFGKFPFDDTSHRILLAQVQAKVKFPAERNDVTEGCKNLLDKIFQPWKARYTIQNIKIDPWYHTHKMKKIDNKLRANSLKSTMSSNHSSRHNSSNQISRHSGSNHSIRHSDSKT